MKNFLVLLLFFVAYMSSAQETTQKLTLSFENAGIEEVIKQIEAQSNYEFFYVNEWLGEVKVTGNYTDITIEELLDTILNSTLLNFYVTKGKEVILTKNNIIYDELPDGFFEPSQTTIKTTSEENNVSAPVFFNEVTTSEIKSVETVRIGKSDKSSTRKRYTLQGIITNATNGGPVANLALVVKGKNIGVETDETGAFEIDLPAGINILETNSLGFEKLQKRVIIYNDGRLDFKLNEAYQGLDEVLVQANVDRNVKDAIAGTTEINMKEIKNIPLVLGERDIFKVAATLPGITNTGEGASGYNVRGGKTDQNLVLLDDGVLYNPAHFFGIFSAVNPFTTSDVTIYKGNIPARFGGRLSSVFDIKTKDAATEKFTGEGSIGPVTSNLVLETPIKKGESGIMIGGRSTYSDWILQNLNEDELKNSRASFYDIIAKYNHILGEDDNVKATAYYSRDAFSITSDSLYKYKNRLISLRWNHNFDEKNSGSLILTNSQNQFGIDFDGDTNTDFDLDYTINETELKLNLNHTPNEKHRIDYGIATKLYNVEPGNISPADENSIITNLSIPKERALESGIYLADTFSVTDKLTVDAGFRYSFYMALGALNQRIYEDELPKSDGTLIGIEEFGKNEVVETYGNPEFRLSARYLLAEDLSVKASYNNNAQYIHSLSSNTTVSPTDTWKLSDKNIKPQRASQYSLGLFKNIKDNTFELSAEGYYKRTKDILDYKVGAELLLNELIEQDVLQGEGKAYGVEFLLKKTKGKLNGWLGYSYSRSFVKLDGDFPEEQVNNGVFFPSNYDKPHDFSFVGNYKFTKRYSFSANFVYQTGRPVTVPVGNFFVNNSEFVLYSDRNAFRIPDYFRLDISINIEGNHKIKKLAHSFWNISIYNVLGRNNPYSVFFVNEFGEINAYKTSIFGVPIPTISYNFRF